MMNQENVYQSPDADLTGSPVKKKSTILKRFLLTFFWSAGVFVAVVLLALERTEWFNALIGSTILSAFSGVVAMLVPVSRAWIYVSIGVFFGLTAAFLIGITVAS